jgi:hypothetical protein
MDAAFLQSLLPAEAGVRITAVTVEPGAVAVALVTTGVMPACPRCGSVSTTVHGRYHRTARDRPCLGLPVHLTVAAHRHLGLALGGEAGARLAAGLGLPTNPDAILRRAKGGPDEPAPRPRHVGIDDRATRMGQTYGTILVDLERGTVMDLLPGRDGEALKVWLAADRQVEVITRDRWPAYI